MKCKSILAVLAAAAVFASCSKDDKGLNASETTSVQMRLTFGGAETRAETLPVNDNDAVTFNDGFLYFVDSNGQITDVLTILNTGAGTGDNETTVDIADLETGATLKNIQSTAEKVYFIGNVPSSAGTLPTGGLYSAVAGKMAAIHLQADASGGVDNVSLYGEGTVVPGVAPAPSTATFNVYPIVARIQIPNLTASGVVTGFQVDGIFINNFYHQVGLDGTVAAGNKISYVQSDTWLPDDPSVPYYSTAPIDYTGILFDYAAAGLGTFNTPDYEPAAGNVWAYNVFAGKGTTGEVPRVVFRITGVTTSDGSTFSDPQFVTVKRFKENAAPNNLITTLTGGSVYTFSSIPVSETNLKPTPEVEPVDVLVDVTLMPWKEVTIDPEF